VLGGWRLASIIPVSSGQPYTVVDGIDSDLDGSSAGDRPEIGNISVYARNRDYHDLVKGLLKHLAQFIVSRFGPGVKVFVDTAPVMEKPLAEQAGLGWQGKHTNLVSRRNGSWLFLGELYTTLDLPPDPRRQPPVEHGATGAGS